MSMQITLELSDQDLEHFRELARRGMSGAEAQSPDAIIGGARALLEKVGKTVNSTFIRDRLGRLNILIDMYEDEGWGMQKVGQKRVLSALAYLVNADDLIPDNVPGLGYLDDAIMVELLCEELKPEIDAYLDFIEYRTGEAERRGVEPESLNRSDFIKVREQALLSEMRRVRNSRSGRRASAKSPFSLF